jgi:hypothetical protein
MAKVTIKRSNKTAGKQAEALKPDAEPEVQEVETEETQEEVPAGFSQVPLPEEVEPPKPAPAPRVAKVKGDDMVRIQIMKNMAAPEVGSYKFSEHHGVSRVLAGQLFIVPVGIASHLCQTKAAVKVM